MSVSIFVALRLSKMNVKPPIVVQTLYKTHIRVSHAIFVGQTADSQLSEKIDDVTVIDLVDIVFGNAQS